MARRALVPIAFALVLAACGGSDEDPPGVTGSVAAEAANEAVLGLCEMAAEHIDDLETADAVFLDRSHDTLHLVAAAVEAVDRPAAAALLTAKQQVEADLGADPPGPGLADDLEELLSATREALARIGLSAPDCPA